MLKKYLVLLPFIILGTSATARLFGAVIGPSVAMFSEPPAAPVFYITDGPGGDEASPEEYTFHVDACDAPLADVKARFEVMTGVQSVSLDEAGRLLKVTCKEGTFCPYSAMASLQHDGFPVDLQPADPSSKKPSSDGARDGSGSCPYLDDAAVTKDIRQL